MMKPRFTSSRPGSTRLKILPLLLGLSAVLGILGMSVWAGKHAPPRPLAAEAAAQAAGAQPDPEALIARIEAPQSPARRQFDGLTVGELMQRFGTPGVSVAVVHDFEVHWARGYGVADAETGRPVENRTMFQAASISKPITALAAMRLVEEGRFTLDDDITSILRSWRVPEVGRSPEQPVTPRSLMSHTSGADDGFGFPGYPPGAPLPSLVKILNGEHPSNVGPVRFARPPFGAYKYSGGSYALLQLALTDLTGQSFEEIMRTQVLEPLGMFNSTYVQPLPEALHVQAARAHGSRGQPLDEPWHVYPEQAAAGLWTTATDLARVVVEVQRALRGHGAVLSRSSAQAMTTPVGVGPFAIGFAVGKEGEGWYFEHSGSNYGFRALLRGHLRHGYGIVVLTNGADGSNVAAEIASRVARAYDWDSTHEPLRR